jgi:UDP-N-acetylmuramoyl-L-alanyl-D-glutamate--2,6-diaminopimelate ligase
LEGFDRNRYKLIVDRREAIEKAIQMAKPTDVVLICGKGHETGQTIKEKTYEFDDRMEARKVLGSKKK